jgi:hypothetical protein
MIDELMNKVLRRVYKEANQRKEDAGFGGHMHDGGGGNMESEARYYEYGASGICPPEWQHIKEQVEREKDPEYATFLKLKAKFEKSNGQKRTL